MQEAPTPVNEAQRLQSLRRLGLLDTQPEERFDRLTRMAARLFKVPIALVSLVDSNRQWFKAGHGVSISETPRRVSFCAHAIHDDDPLVIPNCLDDERFADNPLVVGPPGIRAYAGQPLHSRDGARVGTLCIIDTKQRAFSAADLALLSDLAGLVEQEMSMLSLASVDEVTSISNRRGFEILAEHVLALCHRQHQMATLILFDLAGLLDLNVTRGNGAADHAARLFADHLLQHFRTSDVVARLSATQFVVLASGATEAQMTKSLERLQQRLADSGLAKSGLSWSTAIVAFDPAYSLDLDKLLQTAQANLGSPATAARAAAG